MAGRARRARQAELEGREVAIRDLSHDGRGVAEVDGKVMFVHGALPGERVTIARVRVRRSYDEAEAGEVVQASPDRRAPPCEVFGRCGGCALQHQAPEAQVAAKQATLLSNLERIGGVQPEQLLEPLLGPTEGYRRRARLSVRHVPGKGRVLVGFRERSAPYVTDMQRCPILDPRLVELPQQLSSLIGTLSIRDQIPQVEVSAGDEVVALVIRNKAEPDAADRAQLAAFAQAQGMDLYLQPGGLDSVTPLGEASPLRYALSAEEDAISFRFEPTDFVQVNAAVNRSMVARALELIAPQPGTRVLDLYCGLGNFSLALARAGAEVTGVEGDPGLVARARENAERQGIGGLSFHAADLSEAPAEAAVWTGRYQRVLLDPPRAGAQAVLAAIAASGAERIVYVSCHTGSLARDLGELVSQHGYRLQAAGVMDMFPHTAHVESIAVLEAGPSSTGSAGGRRLRA